MLLSLRNFEIEGSEDSAITQVDKPSGWNHFSLVYEPNTRVTVYLNGIKAAQAASQQRSKSLTTGSGQFAVGEYFVDLPGNPGGVTVDELKFFNKPLTATEAQALYDAYT